MYKWPVWDEARRGILEIGIGAYLRRDHITATHVLVPQVEAAVRRLLELLGRPVYEPNRKTGGISLRQLGSLLRDPSLEQGLGPKLVYLRTLLIDPRDGTSATIYATGCRSAMSSAATKATV